MRSAGRRIAQRCGLNTSTTNLRHQRAVVKLKCLRNIYLGFLTWQTRLTQHGPIVDSFHASSPTCGVLNVNFVDKFYSSTYSLLPRLQKHK